MSDAEGAQDDMRVGAAAGVNDPGDIPCRTIGGLQGPALGDNNEVQGGTEGGVSVGGDRAAAEGPGVKLTKEEKRKWKNRMKKQSPSAKTTHGRKDGGNHGQACDARRLAKDSYIIVPTCFHLSQHGFFSILGGGKYKRTFP